MAQNEDEAPSWLTDTPSPDPVPPPAQTAPAPSTFADPVETQQPVAAPAQTPAPSPPTDPSQMTPEDQQALRGEIMFMRLANLALSITIVIQASLNLSRFFTSPEFWVLSFYSACGALLICCLETQLSFVRTTIALNFGFLFNPVLRFAYYILLATVCYSTDDFFGKICAGCLVGLALYNTYVLIRYPAYRKMRDEIAKEEDERIQAAIRDRVRKEAASAMFSRK